MVGHSYFLGETSGALAETFVFQVLPLLNEYRREGLIPESAAVMVEGWPGDSGIPLIHDRPFELAQFVTDWIEQGAKQDDEPTA
jgi:hypothetical protein